ncbi:MAG: hypothetical protein QM479_08160 [Pseudomonadota bacterium]
MFDSVFIVYFVYIVAYFIVHSVFASLWFKQWFFIYCPNLRVNYRLFFNILSMVLLIPLILLLLIYPGEKLWQWLGWQAIFFNLLAIIAMIGFYLSLSDYDLNEFFGFDLSSFSLYSQPAKEQLHIGRFHLYIRHPWYFFLLVLIWTRDMTTYQLLTAALITAYLIVGSYLEERKLHVYFGKVYQQYQQRVPGLFPLPWKYLTRKEADKLLKCDDL